MRTSRKEFYYAKRIIATEGKVVGAENFLKNKDDFVYSSSKESDLQTAINDAYAIFESVYADERKLWDIGEYSTWKYQPATEAQLKYIQSKLGKEEWDSCDSLRTILIPPVGLSSSPSQVWGLC